MLVIVRPRWGSAVFLAVLLHIVVLCAAGLLLPDEGGFSDDGQEIAWLDVSDAEDASEQTASPVQEKPETSADEEVGQEEMPVSELMPSPPKEAARTPLEGEKKSTDGREKKTPPKERDYPAMRKPNKPAVLREETKRGLTEKETAYRGHVQFFADISQEGRVTGVQAWQFEPEITDETERRLLEERLEKRIKESWRYAPSLTPEGVPTTQTKAEELDIPEKEKPKDDR
ncbi:hypothetical protein [uncultured Selenomonas sp.]|uniref:hypothetical protein n=1 Tax=uncultured Selenomonas sp. TaxID=159275 RepID=UPI0028E6C39D|nr:hypothetical protein [uncultured Selenomonas sp.]